MKRKRKRKGPSSLDVVFPVSLLLISVFTGLWAYPTLTGHPISFPGIGIPGLSGSSGSSGYGNTINVTGSSGAQLIPPNELGYQMMIQAYYVDGTNDTLSTAAVGNIPTLDFVRVHNKPVKSVVANAVIGVSAPNGNPLPANSAALFKVNFTAKNENTAYVKWHYLEIKQPFTNGGTLSMVKLPALSVLPWEAFSDICNVLSNGTLACSNGPTPQTHRVDWMIRATVVVSTPTNTQFALIGGATVSSADFGVDGSVTGCTGCGGSNSAAINGDVNSEGGLGRAGGAGLAGSSGPGLSEPSGPSSAPPDSLCGSFLPIFCVTGEFGANGNEGGGGSTGGDSSGGGISGNSGDSGSPGGGIGGCASFFPIFCDTQSLLPLSLLPRNYLRFNVPGFNVPGRTWLLNTNYLLYAIILYIVVIIAAIVFVAKRK